MSFLHHTPLSGTVPLQTHSADVDPKKPFAPEKTINKKSSYSALLSSFTSLVKDPTGSLDTVLEALWVPNPSIAQERKRKEDLMNRKQILQQRMEEATDHATWKLAATALDDIEGKHEWKRDPVSPHYDHELLEKRLNELNEAKTSGDVSRMLFLVRTSLTRSLGNMGDVRLYKHSHVGTKFLIEDYISAACGTLDTFLESFGTSQNSKLDPRNVMDQLLATRQAFGRSALLLSGGGTFGMTHIGVVKCLWENKMLPRIISGASAGSIVCSVLCARTDQELPDTMAEFCYGDLEVFGNEQEESFLTKAARFAKYGALFDIEHLKRVMQGLLGDLTFQEAYNRTRRILNISVSTASMHELPTLLNYITAPNVIIWSAVAASCSVPLIFSPAPLLSKDPRTGALIPWNPAAQKWIDGSVDNDLPMTRLAEMFNVNHFIVSQVNPHVVPFLVHDESVNAESALDASSETSTTWLNMLAGFAKSEALHRMHVLSELGVLSTYFTKLRSVLSQKYSGDITILPEVSYTQFPRVLRNPTTDFMLNAMICGERATWPKLSRIQNHCAIELALDDAIQKLRTRIAFSPSQVDLRMISLGGITGHHKISQQDRVRKHGPVHPTSKTRGKLVGRSARAAKTKSWVGDEKSLDRQKVRLSEPPQGSHFLRSRHMDASASRPTTADGNQYSGSDTNDEDEMARDSSEDEGTGLTFMKTLRKPFLARFHSHHGRHRSYPTPVGRRRAAMESTDDGNGDPNLTTTTAYDSSCSNPRSYSPSSEPRSPSPEIQDAIGRVTTRSTPSLWRTGSRASMAMRSVPNTPGIRTFRKMHDSDDDDDDDDEGTNTEMGNVG